MIRYAPFLGQVPMTKNIRLGQSIGALRIRAKTAANWGVPGTRYRVEYGNGAVDEGMLLPDGSVDLRFPEERAGLARIVIIPPRGVSVTPEEEIINLDPGAYQPSVFDLEGIPEVAEAPAEVPAAASIPTWAWIAGGAAVIVLAVVSFK